jgi:hypothetical protein
LDSRFNISGCYLLTPNETNRDSGYKGRPNGKGIGYQGTKTVHQESQEEREVNMLGELGVMFGIYIITRCFSFMSRTGDRAETMFVRVLSGVTAVVAALVMLDLVMRGMPEGFK